MGLFNSDRIIISPPVTLPAPTPPAQPCNCPPVLANPPAATAPPVATTPPVAPISAPSQVVVVQPAGDQGAYTQNGKHYMSPLLVSNYYAAKLVSATGQAHLLMGATDAQLLEDYRNGDISPSVLSLFQMTVPKGMVQIKQSPVMTSPEFPVVSSAGASSFDIPGGTWTFNVPSGWSYTVTPSAPMQRQALPALVRDDSRRVPSNITFTMDTMRSVQVARSDGSLDVTVAGDWAEEFPPTENAERYPSIPAGTYGVVIVATLYPADNPPPSS